MAIQTRCEGNIVIVSVSGRLDAVTAPLYGITVRELLDSGATRLVLDLDQVDYVSSAGVGEILASTRLLKARDGQFCIANAGVNAVSVFKICGVAGLLQMHSSVGEALVALA